MSTFNASTYGSEVVTAFPGSVKDKTFVITGPSQGGIGGQTALYLASAHPSEIFLLGRTESKITPIINEINVISPTTKVHFIPLDLGSFTSIRLAAAKINTLTTKIDVLINNAGIMGTEFSLTEDGIESQFGCNHIGHFLLTNLLSALLLVSPSPRIINVSSNGFKFGEVRFDDYNFAKGKDYDKWTAYGQSKTANILFTVALAERGMTSFALHPGQIYTNLGSHIEMTEWPAVFELFAKRGFEIPAMEMKQLGQGTSTTLVAALDPSLGDKSPAFLEDCKIVETPNLAHSRELAEKLWALSEQIVGQKFGF